MYNKMDNKEKQIQQWYTFDIVSLDENGFTLSINPEPPSNMQVVFVQFERTTWKEYIMFVVRNLFKKLGK